MFENFTAGQLVTIQFAGATQSLAMRAVYEGERDGVHALRGTGVMADAEFGAIGANDGWTLTNGRPLLSVEAV